MKYQQTIILKIFMKQLIVFGLILRHDASKQDIISTPTFFFSMDESTIKRNASAIC
jgi:hypothetical protein